jgi:predicted nuclease of predicted toxin-antitoxin system
VKLREPFTYFVDRSLGRGLVVESLRAAKLEVHAHDDHFAQNTPDAEWLVEIGRRGWVVLTKDKNIRVNAVERVALVRANVACIMLGRGDLTAPAMAQVFVDALPLIQRVLRRFALPLAASLSSGKSLRVLLAAGEWLSPPKEIK